MNKLKLLILFLLNKQVILITHSEAGTIAYSDNITDQEFYDIMNRKWEDIN